MVIDTSALLALYFDEPHADWVATQMNTYAEALCMSTVNVAETLIHLEDRQPARFEGLRESLLSSGIDLIAPDAVQAQTAAAARLRYPLNLGDCFVYALARNRGCLILALDRDFRSTDADVLMPE